MQRRVRRLVPLAAAAASLTLAGAAAAALSVPFGQPPRNVDLLSEADAQIDGARAGDRIGWRLATGDVDGDGVGVGVGDTVIGSQSDAAVVVGGELPALFDLSLYSASKWTIEGPSAGTSLEIVGDVNGDGKDDLLVSGGANQSWVVYGKDGNATVRLLPVGGFIGQDGFGIVSEPGPRAVEFDRAGDVNGDGLGDILVLDAAVDTAYVVFGKTSNAPVTLASLGSGGYTVTGAEFDRLASAGDVNRDGRGDLLLSDHGFDGAVQNVGRVWVVFGKANTTPVDVNGLGASGYVIEGGSEGDQIGRHLANAGDANGDGTPDHLVVHGSGTRASVVFGRASGTRTVTLAPTGFRGYAIEAEPGAPIDSVAGGADTNGDGLADQVLGSRRADSSGRTGAGAAWVVFGKADKAGIALEDDAGGYRMDGPAAGAELTDVAFHTLGSRVNVLAGFWRNDANGNVDSGSVYEVDDGSELPRLPVENATLSSSSVRFVAGAGAAQRPTVTFDALVPVNVRLVLSRLTKGNQTRTGACVPGTPRRAQRACTIVERVRTSSFAVAEAGTVSVPVRGSFRPGSYALTMRVTVRNGRSFGPFRAVFRVTP